MNTVACIEQLEQRLRDATLTNNVAAHRELLADDWMNINANGTVTTKPQLLTLLQTSPFQFINIADEDVHIRSYNHTAIVAGRSVRERLATDGTTIKLHARFTRVYVHVGSNWQVVSAQATAIAP